MRICICDDELFACKNITEYVKMFFSESNLPQIFICKSGEELLEKYSSGKKFDIIFLDIEMNGINGIEVAERIRKRSQNEIIIFVSSHKNYVFSAFKCEAFHFLVKPINKSEFNDVFGRAIHKYKLLNEYYPISWKQSISNIRIDDIIFIEGYSRRLKFHTTHGKYESVGKLSEAQEKLKSHGFISIHQGYLINMRYIRSFRGTSVELETGEKLTASARRQGEALRMYDMYIQKWKW